jgi:hypothetical protein
VIEVFFIAIINLFGWQISATQTFSFSVRIRREMDVWALFTGLHTGIVNGLD